MHQSELLYDVLIFLVAAIVVVVAFNRLRTSPVVGYLVAGMLIGPFGFALINESESATTLAEFGVVFLLFMIGLEFSRERLRAMANLVFGLGALQVVLTAVVIGSFAAFVLGLPREAAIIVGAGLALSSTAFVLQILTERSERATPFGNASFAILLFQDLAIVPFLMLVSLFGAGSENFWAAMGFAILKAVLALLAVILIGRLAVRPLFRLVAETRSAELFVAATLLTILGTGWLLTLVDISMVMGAFLAGLLLSETEYRHQIEADIRPFRGILLGLFFMTVGMSINSAFVVTQALNVILVVAAILVTKTVMIGIFASAFGFSRPHALRIGFLLAQGGEFGFVLFLAAGNAGILSEAAVQLLLTAVTVTMILSPLMAASGARLAGHFEDRKAQATHGPARLAGELEDHIIIAGFGRVGQTVSKLLNDAGVTNVALDTNAARVGACRKAGHNAYYGDASQVAILQSMGAGRARGAVVTIDQPLEVDRVVSALREVAPDLPTFVRARDLEHARALVRLGATEAVPEALEASLQLGAITLAAIGAKPSEVFDVLQELRESDYEELGDTIDGA